MNGIAETIGELYVRQPQRELIRASELEDEMLPVHHPPEARLEIRALFLELARRRVAHPENWETTLGGVRKERRPPDPCLSALPD
jgi:hypothetical protein